MLLTTDRQLRHQQNLARRKVAIVVLPTTSWPKLKAVASRIAEAIASAEAGTVTEFSDPGI